MNKVSFSGKKKSYFYYIATYGTTPGNNGYLADKNLSQNTGIKFYALSNKETVAVINKNAEPQIDEIIQKIQQKSSGNFMRNKLPKFVAPSYKPYYENMRKTKHFTVDDSCIGCRLCEKMG